MQSIQISVVIPVYNAAPYVRHAVESALAQPETAEVVLVEDGSPDDSLRMCNELADKYESVRLLRHPNGENRGAAASRNLGIRESQYDVIAFLDADDFYTPNRFRVSGRILAEQPEIDGVYEAAQPHFEDETAQKRWESLYPGYEGGIFRQDVTADNLFEALIERQGIILLIGLVVRKQALLDVGLFSENLRVGQDAVMIFKLAAVKVLVRGLQETSAVMFRIHAHNRVTGVTISLRHGRNRFQVWLEVWAWGGKQLTKPQKLAMIQRLSALRIRLGSNTIKRMLAAIIYRLLLIELAIKAPELLTYPQFRAYLIPVPLHPRRIISPNK